MATVDIKHKIYTMCMVQDGTKVLLMNRPNQKGFPGYIAPGGKVDFPESIVNGAIREVKEETGLIIKDIIYKGLVEFCEPNQGLRYMVFNYLATSFEGDLLDDPPEGELLWVEIEEAFKLPMQDWFKQRFPLFFQQGTFEISSVWDEASNETLEKTVKNYGSQALIAEGVNIYAD
jgi:8-oxo-dGTP diphosphatase